MTGYIVVMKNPVLCAPYIQSLLLDVLPQMPPNIAIELPVDGLGLGDRFLMHNTVHVKSTMSMLFHDEITGYSIHMMSLRTLAHESHC